MTSDTDTFFSKDTSLDEQYEMFEPGFFRMDFKTIALTVAFTSLDVTLLMVVELACKGDVDSEQLRG